MCTERLLDIARFRFRKNSATALLFPWLCDEINDRVTRDADRRASGFVPCGIPVTSHRLGEVDFPRPVVTAKCLAKKCLGVRRRRWRRIAFEPWLGAVFCVDRFELRD